MFHDHWSVAYKIESSPSPLADGSLCDDWYLVLSRLRLAAASEQLLAVIGL